MINQNKVYKILVAEDEEVNYYYIQNLFEEFTGLKYKLLHAANGQEAIDLCNKNQDIDLILLDIRMPLLNGIDAAKEIRIKNSRVPIVIQSAYSTLTDKSNANAAGCTDFIMKPLEPITFENMLKKYLQ